MLDLGVETPNRFQGQKSLDKISSEAKMGHIVGSHTFFIPEAGRLTFLGWHNEVGFPEGANMKPPRGEFALWRNLAL